MRSMTVWFVGLWIAVCGLCEVKAPRSAWAIKKKVVQKTVLQSGRNTFKDDIDHARQNGNVITEDIAKKWVKVLGLDVPAYELVADPKNAGTAADNVGYPLVVKVVSKDILHKTDVGGVVKDVKNKKQTTHAVKEMLTRLGSQYDVKGALIEKMLDRNDGIELIVGLLNDPTFGPTIMAGRGGTETEIYKDVAHLPLPATKRQIMNMLKPLGIYNVLKGYRGSAPVDMNQLAETIKKLGNIILEHPEDIASADFNPVLVKDNKFMPLDAKILLNPEPNKNALSKAKPIAPEKLYNLFNPQTVAFVGASDKGGNNAIMRALMRLEGGDIIPINPNKSVIEGRNAYKSLSDIPKDKRVDLAVISIALEHVPQVLKEAAQRNIGNIVILAGGGNELGGDRADLETQLKQALEEGNMFCMGMNCAGEYVAARKLDTMFQGEDRMARPKPGKVGVLSQSGTFAINHMGMYEKTGVSKVISYGNRTNVDEADFLHYLGQDPETQVISFYIEGTRDGRKLMNVAKDVTRKGKPIVMFKNGRTDEGAKQAASHTGTLGGAYNIFKSAMNQAGVILVDNNNDLVATTKAIAWQPKPKGNRIAIVTNGAGPSIEIIDKLAPKGLKKALVSNKSLQHAKKNYPPSYVIGRTVFDLTGSASMEDYRKAIQTLMDDPNVDIVVPWFVFEDDPLEKGIVNVLADFQKQGKKPMIVGALPSDFTDEMKRQIEQHNVPVFASADEVVAAASGLVKAAEIAKKAHGNGSAKKKRPVRKNNETELLASQ